MSTLTAIRIYPEARSYYEKKRAEGKAHRQALMDLARRRVNVLWALVRDGHPYRHRVAPSLAAA